MEDKRTIKISLVMVICVFIIILLLVALFGMWYCYNYNRKLNNNNLADKSTFNSVHLQNEVTVESENEGTKDVNKKYKDKEIVFDLYNKESSDYLYKIPYVNIDSEEVDTVNREIENYYKPLIEKELNNEKEGLSITMGKIEYNSYLNENVLSLVISNIYPNNCIYYKVYNIDIYKGKEISNTELINQKNTKDTELLNKMKELYKQKFISLYGTKDSYINNLRNSSAGWSEEELKQQSDLYEKQLNRTTSIDNYSIETSMFLDENENINVIANIYSLAGAESYYYVINTNI